MNRNSIFMFVNGRLIRDRLLLHALSSAYHNLMPPACYPFALLFLDCDCEEVDVNVHPSKTEVRFRHGNVRARFRARRDSRTLDRRAAGVQHSASAAAAARGRSAVFRVHPAHRESALRAGARAPRSAPERIEDLPVFHAEHDRRARRRASISRPMRSAAGAGHARPARAHAMPEAPQSLAALSRSAPLGQIHDSFIIAAGRDGLWIIDQHVAHERILFEQVLRQQAQGRVERSSC